MSKQVLVTEAKILGTISDFVDSVAVGRERSVVEKASCKAELRSQKIIKRANAKAAKIIASAKKKATSIAEKSKARLLSYSEKREKKDKLLAAKVIESAEKHKAAYRVENWKTYNESLKARGEITLYLSPEVLRELKNMSKKKL